MNNILILQLIVSFFAGGLFIAMQTLLGERLTGLWRSIILTVPSTLALGLFFIGLTKTPVDVKEAAMIVPAALGIDYIFVGIFVIFVLRGLVLSFIGGFLGWAVFAYLLVSFPPVNFLWSIVYGAFGIAFSYVIVSCLHEDLKLKKFPMTYKYIIIRSIIGGTIISLIVFLSKSLGNIWGGLFSVFPAAYSSMFIIYYYLQGAKSIRAVSKSLFFPGVIGFFLYAWVAGIAFPEWGIWLGTLVSYSATFLFYYSWSILTKLNRVEESTM